MATIAKLAVLLDLQDNAFQRGLQNSRDKLDKWGSSLRDIGGKMTLGVTTPVIAGFTKMALGAAELEQSIGATEKLWGDNAAEIIDWAAKADRSMGLTQNQALASVNNFNAMFKQLGAGSDVVQDMSQRFVGLSADLSAMWGGSTIEASESLTSALRGNYEGLDKYNINLTEAMVSQEAMNVALADGRDEITEADKLQARYNLILEQTTDAQGQFADEANTTSGRIAILRARIGNLATKMGGLLLPYVNKLADGLSKVVDWLEGTNDTTRKWALGIAAAAAAMGPLLIALGIIAPGLGILLGLFGALLSPIGLLIAILAVLAVMFKDDIVDAVKSAADKFGDITEAFRKFREMGVSPAQAALMAIAAVVPGLGKIIAPLRGLVENLGDAFNALKAGDYAGMFAALGAAARSVGSTILGAIRSIDWSAVGGALLDGLASIVGWVAGFVLDIPEIAVNVWNWARGTIADFWGWLKGIALGGLAGDGTGGATDTTGQLSLAEIAVNIYNWAKGTVVDIYEAIKGWISDQITGRDWSSIGTTVMTDIRNAIRDAIPNAVSLVATFLTWISDQIRGVNWKSVGSTFGELLVGGIKGIVGLVGLSLWLLGQVLLAIVDVQWGEVGSAFKTFFGAALTAITDFLSGFWSVIQAEIETELSLVPWAAIGDKVETWAAGIWSGIMDALQPIIDAAVDSLNFLIDQLNRIPGVDIPKIGGIEQIGLEADAAAEKVVSLQDSINNLLTGGTFEFANASGMWSNVYGNAQADPYDPTQGGVGQSFKPFGDISTTFDAVAEAAGRASAAITPVNTEMATLSGRTTDISAFGDTATEKFTSTGDSAKANMQPIGPLAATMAGQLLGTAVPAFVQVNSAGQSNFGALLSAVQSRFTTMQSIISSTTSQASSTARSQFSSMTSAITSQVNSMSSQVQGRFSSMQGSVSGSLNAMTGNARNAASQLQSSLSSGAAQAAGAVQSQIGRLPGIVSGIAGAMYGAGADAIQGLVNGAQSRLGALEGVVNQAIAIMARIPSLGNSPWPMMIGAGHDAMDGLIIGVDDREHRLTRAIDNVVGQFSSATPTLRPDIESMRAGGGEVRQYFFALTSAEFKALLAKAENGDAFARNFGSELAMMGGQG